MIDWLQSGDDALFRFINHTLRNGVLDALMPLASDTPGFVPVVILALVALIWKGGARGRLCAAMLVLGLCAGDWVIADAMKHGVARLRPFNRFPDAHVLVGKSASFSMPSSHALNWFLAAIIVFIFYRKSIYYMLPLAVIVSFSRIYNGVHYPSDVLAGAVIGAGCGAAVVWSANALWQWAGRRWFPLWQARLPSLMQPVPRPPSSILHPPSSLDKQWLNLGYVLIALLLLVRLAYLAAGKIELSEDEAYQWIWSKHLALSYYSKPLLIACVQFLGTHLWGDHEFGVRFFSPVISAGLSLLLLRFLAREVSGRTAFFVVTILNVTPLMALGSMLMTIDPLSVLFWTAAMVAGWRAVQPGGTTRQWLWVGLWMGLGSLGKYTNLFQWVCWGVFFVLWPPARAHLRRKGPWLALLLAAVCLLPIVVWNAQHDWITIQHVASDGRLGQRWERTFTWDFLWTEALVLHPFFFLGALWAAAAFWRVKPRNAFALFLFSMGAPLFLFYLALSLHSRIELNWIAPSVVPLFCLMAVYWEVRWAGARRALKPLLGTGIGIGFMAAVLALDPNLLTKVLHRAPPPSFNPLRRVLGWKELAQMAGQERRDLERRAGKPVFIIGEHYGFTSEITFYLPEAKSRVGGEPLVFCYASREPRNQFYFWPDYLGRTGQDALFVREVDRPKLRPGWISEWWRHSNDLYLTNQLVTSALPPELRGQFEAITDLGVKDDVYSDKGVLRRAQFFACHNLLSATNRPR
ncbi:MAG: glycosyltransferase family 39 protein [Verrucomicrobiota bacterium]|jgi:4-amino-4-deoxy-L-arabinose transferase-like glycosyltransferase/membrane-associated phospholipid phosphatase